MGLDLAVQAYDSYLAGIEEGRFKPLAARRRAYGPSASRVLGRARPALEKVLGVPTEGTIVAEGKKNQSGSINVAQAEADKASRPPHGQRTRTHSIGEFKEAAKLATRAKRHVDKGLSGLEAFEPPDYDELQAYLKKTIDGIPTTLAGGASYVKGIKSWTRS